MSVNLTPHPGAPQRREPANYADKADAFMAWLETWSGELDQLQAALLQLQSTVVGYKNAAEQAAQTATEKEALMSPHYNDIDTLALHIDNVNAAAAALDNINAVADKLTQLQTVVDNIQSVIDAAANTSNINTVAGINASVTAVAAVQTELQAVYANLAEILQADDNAQAASESASAAYSSAQSAAQAAQAALNAAAGNIIDDNTTATNKAWSSTKTAQSIADAISALPPPPAPPPIVNNLNSTLTDTPLSAAMGKHLQDTKQSSLVSGSNIKTLNNQSLLGAGNISIKSGLTLTAPTSYYAFSTKGFLNQVFAAAVDGTRFLIVYGEGDRTKARVGTVVGSTITYGNAIDLATSDYANDYASLIVSEYNANKAYFISRSLICTITINGTVLTHQTHTASLNGSSAGVGIHAVEISATRMLVAAVYNNNSANIYNVTLTSGAISAFTNLSNIYPGTISAITAFHKNNANVGVLLFVTSGGSSIATINLTTGAQIGNTTPAIVGYVAWGTSPIMYGYMPNTSHVTLLPVPELAHLHAPIISTTARMVQMSDRYTELHRLNDKYLLVSQVVQYGSNDLKHKSFVIDTQCRVVSNTVLDSQANQVAPYTLTYINDRQRYLKCFLVGDKIVKVGNLSTTMAAAWVTTVSGGLL